MILSVEVWRDQAALDAHMTHAHTADFLADRARRWSPANRSCASSHAEPVQEEAR